MNDYDDEFEKKYDFRIITKFETNLVDVRINFDSIIALILNEQKINVIYFDEQYILTNNKYNNKKRNVHDNKIILNKFDDNDERLHVI